MKAQELRIGNWVKFYETCEGSISSFYEHGVHMGYGKTAPFQDLEPIPLTEEWLVKSGSEKLQFGCIYVMDRFKLIWKESYKYWYVIDYENGTYLNKIEFVHEWQNFYFVMNGKELEIKDS